MAERRNTLPADDQDQAAAADHIVLAPSFKDEKTGALYVHKDLVQVQEPWAEEAHTSPVKVDERFGDVESWVAYVQQFGAVDSEHLLTWNSKGLTAVLDYPNRRQWTASHPFLTTPEFKAWSGIAMGAAVEHKKFIEFLEDHAPDIFEPEPLGLLNMLRTLKAATSATFESTPKADGTAEIRYSKSSSVNTGAQSLDLPPEITIQIPVLRGHVAADGGVVRYKLVCRLRASVDGNAALALRLTMPAAERVLEEVYAERVAAAKEALGAGFRILRAAEQIAEWVTP